MEFNHKTLSTGENGLIVSVLEDETTFSEIARMLTIGGEQYADAIRRYNNDTAADPLGSYFIPVTWLNDAGKSYYVSTFDDPRLAVEIVGSGSREKILGLAPKNWALILGAAVILYLVSTEKNENESFD